MTNKINGIVTVGWDRGFGVEKALSNCWDAVVFPGVWGKARQIKFRAKSLTEKYPGDQISDDEGTWFVGDLAQTQLATAEQRTLRGRTGDGDNGGIGLGLRLFKAAMAKMTAGQIPHGEVIHVDLTTGLPVDHMHNAEALKMAYEGQHLVKTDLGEFVVNVVKVRVMPQPYGVIYDRQLKANGELNPAHVWKRTAVLDVGTYTADGTVDDDGDYIDSLSGSVEAGLHTAQRLFSEYYEKTFGEKPGHKTIEAALRTKTIMAYGERVDLREQVEEWLEPTRIAAVGLATNLWKAGASLDVLWVAGGGAEVVYEALVGAGFKQAKLVEQPQLSIARGYLKYGLFAQGQAI